MTDNRAGNKTAGKGSGKTKLVSKIKRTLKIAAIVIVAILVCFIAITGGINIYVRQSVKKNIIRVSDAEELTDVDCIIVLGASVYPEGPSIMLKDRLDKAIELYKRGCAPKLLMSGDHGGDYYDEVTVMKNYAVDAGVPSEDIFKDHFGYSSYDTMYRAKEIYGARKVIIVTQDYHLARCLYIAEKLGLEAYGVATEDVKYNGQLKRDVREYFAIVKDFGKVILSPEAEKMGSEVSLNQNGDVTNERPEE